MKTSLVVGLLCVMMGVLPSSRSYTTDTLFKRLPSLDDVTLTQSVLADVTARSKGDCGRQCAGRGGCAMLTFLAQQQSGPSGQCLLYRLPTGPLNHQPAPGARTYRNMNHGPCWEGYSLLCGRCLRLLDEDVTYGQGQQRCRELGQAHLVMTKTPDDIQCVVGVMADKGLPTAYLWVGADDLEQEGSWLWHDNTTLPINSQMWATSEPSNGDGLEHCCMLWQTYGALNDVYCTSLMMVLCESQPFYAWP